MSVFRLLRLIMIAILGALPLAGCGDPVPKFDFTILSGSENKELEPILQEFAHSRGVTLKLEYQGSVDIANALKAGSDIAADAVWPANRLWLTLGDTRKVVRHDASIMRSPVILGLRRSVAQKLGWGGKTDVTVADILKAAQAGSFRYATTSATQSNSGASFYFAALHAMAGNPPEALQREHLDDPAVRRQIKELLATIDRSSGSSGWLKTLFLEHSDQLDGMINYESIIWETNQALIKTGQEPLCAVYPSDAVAIADHPLGLIGRSDATREAFFLELQKYLLSPEIQARIQLMGRRTGAIGMEGNATVLRADECFDTRRVISPVPLPDQEVLTAALNLYQTTLRKPSATVYVLDFSGSMQGPRAAELKQAMHTLLDPAAAAANLLQPTADDLHIVIPFNDRIISVWQERGNDPAMLARLLTRIEAQEAGGSTNIYAPVALGLSKLAALGDKLDGYFPAVIMLTDGASNQGRGFIEVQEALANLHLKRPVPVFAIAFGESDIKQLNTLAQATSGKVFDSRKGLIQAFREAKGYN